MDTTPPRLRNSVENLTDQQLSDLRQAFNAVLSIPDERGYNYWAGLHGLPLPKWCQHNNLLLLPLLTS